MPPPAAPPVAAPPPPSPLVTPALTADSPTDDWDDEDEKTTVFDRTAGESAARALLGASAPSKVPPPPPPTASAPGAAPSLSASRAVAPPPAAPPAGPPPVLSGPPPIVVGSGSPPSPQGGIQYSSSQPPSFPSAPAAPSAFGSSPPPNFGAPAVARSSAPPAEATYSPSRVPSYPVPPPQSSSNTGKWIGAGALVLLTVGAFFAFSGGTGTIVVSVGGPGGKAIDNVSILVNDEPKCSQSPCVIDGLAAKTHSVRATAPGFAEMAPMLVKVEKGEETPVNLELIPGSSGTGLNVPSGPSGMKLFVDGKEIGPLPQELTDLSPGSHEIEISGSPYFAPYKKTVSISSNEVLRLDPSFKLEKGQLRVELGQNTDGAEILLLGSGKKPVKLHKVDLPRSIEIPADGDYRIVAKKSGYADFEKRVELTADSPEQTIVVSLEPSEERSSSSSSSSTRSTTSSSSAASSSSSSSAAPSGQGTLNINSIPISSVILDGKPLGSTPKMGVKVKAGTHTVVFVHPQHGRKTQTVTVAPGQTAVAVVRF